MKIQFQRKYLWEESLYMMGGAKLSVLKNLYHRLDATFYFLERLPNNSLFRLLNIKDADLLVSFTKSVLTCYDLHLNIITIEGHTLGVKSGTSYPGCEDDKCREKYQEAEPQQKLDHISCFGHFCD